MEEILKTTLHHCLQRPVTVLTCCWPFRIKVAVMLTLASKLKRDDGLKGSRASATASDSTRRVSVRDRLLVKGNDPPWELFCYPITK